ncbi:MAG: DUF3127 domain-containing protein [Bacteroidaceae bacterium]
MANTIKGKILQITQPVDVSKTGNPFYKCELILDASRYDGFTGEKRENYPSITFTSKNCEKLNGFRAGDMVEVSFILQGRPYQRDGVTKYITDVVGYSVAYLENRRSDSAPAQSPQSVQQPQAPQQPQEQRHQSAPWDNPPF